MVSKNKLRLLLVDDDEDYFILTREMLKEIENTSYYLDWAETYEQALEKISTLRFNAFLFDYNLGKQDGIDLLGESTVIDSKTPVIMLTGKGDLEIDQTAMEAGAADYLNKKHLKPDILERSIRYAIKHKRVLNERELLLREVDHRVKNSFQLVSSILQLETEKLSDKEAIRVLDDCRSRLNIIAILHEKLYLSDNLLEVDAGGYINGILDDWFRSFVTPSLSVRYKLKTGGVIMAIKQLIHLGIIVNELVSNAIKYAFPENFKQERLISISLFEESGTVDLTVADNGKGIPDDFDVYKSKSMGLKLVTILTEEQLGGRLTFKRDNGTKVNIRFKKI